jgi:hypothetical protein
MQRISDTGTLVSILVLGGSTSEQTLDSASATLIAPAVDLELLPHSALHQPLLGSLQQRAGQREFNPDHSCTTERIARISEAYEYFGTATQKT